MPAIDKKHNKKTNVLDRRRFGILLHPTSLPGGIGNGDLGPEAYHFIDFLVHCGASVWQMLPLGPTHDDGSPYMSLSVMAGNPALISIQMLNEWGWLAHEDVEYSTDTDPVQMRTHCLKLASEQFKQNANDEHQQEFLQFIQQQQYWLQDYVLFEALRHYHGNCSWVDWPAPLRDREMKAIKEFTDENSEQIYLHQFIQFVFYRQWHMLKAHASQRGVLLFGDMPIFVAHDSAEVWANRKYFDIDEQGHSLTVAGVPPDYFSETGQRWGNPHYDWKAMKNDDFSWWTNRLQVALELFDLIRIDHFRGFESFWQIKADADTAIEGRWVKTPGRVLFDTLTRQFGRLPFVAEDLGIITAKVDALREKYSWPGMKILQFAFDGKPDNAYLPHNHQENSVVYTGTHDNDTLVHWLETLGDKDRQCITDYFGGDKDLAGSIIRATFSSVARLAILPMQDVLGLGDGHRMNTPGSDSGNWQWGFEWRQVSEQLPTKMKAMSSRYQRI